ncbi:hypothetical protein J3R82DRAFT_5547 [Butyriboletus roseoflavus]|nr:hypothetical protein J3R82DRAFT_5547 [Butyriboletus roseoflavus]
MSSNPPDLKQFRLALIQLGNPSHLAENPTDADIKDANLKHARDMINRAAKDSNRKPDLVVLPHPDRPQECFNSPYGHVHFPVHAETIGYTPGQEYDITKTQSQSVRMLSEAASENRIWLIGGASCTRRDLTVDLMTNQVRYPKGTQLTASSTIPASYFHQKA